MFLFWFRFLYALSLESGSMCCSIAIIRVAKCEHGKMSELTMTCTIHIEPLEQHHWILLGEHNFSVATALRKTNGFFVDVNYALKFYAKRTKNAATQGIRLSCC